MSKQRQNKEGEKKKKRRGVGVFLEMMPKMSPEYIKDTSPQIKRSQWIPRKIKETHRDTW